MQMGPWRPRREGWWAEERLPNGPNPGDLYLSPCLEKMSLQMWVNHGSSDRDRLSWIIWWNLNAICYHLDLECPPKTKALAPSLCWLLLGSGKKKIFFSIRFCWYILDVHKDHIHHREFSPVYDSSWCCFFSQSPSLPSAPLFLLIYKVLFPK